MSDRPENLVLIYLRRIDEKVDRISLDLRNWTRRVGALEIKAANFALEPARHTVKIVQLGVRFDNVGDRLTRIERRLDLIPAH